MSKLKIVSFAVGLIIVMLAVDLLIGNYLAARLSTTSLARRFNLFNPQAPIVVTNRETVRVSNNSDVIDTAQNAATKTATLIYFDGDRLVAAGNAVNWTSDGYFVSAKAAFSATGKVYAVVTSTGELFPVEAVYSDPASDLVLIQTPARSLSVFSPAEPRDLRVGQQVVMIQNSVGSPQAKFYTGFVKRLSTDIAGQIEESDRVSRSVDLQLIEPIPMGSAVLNLSGRMIGVWDGQTVIAVEDIREMANNLLANEKAFVRPAFGFSYQILNEVEARALVTVSGARVIGVAPNQPAARAGLRGGDVITDVNNQAVNSDFNFDAWLR
ncbi:MAG TPA: S1C family serine protease, partial [Candidatus Doudnabacteria bacterium]|nr:S1C family serine protease [Candidatus Doudnabacteria bacterium]